MLSLTALNAMGTLTVRNLDDDLKSRLRSRAAERGRSMEEEVRVILRDVLTSEPAPGGLGSRIARRFADGAGAGLDLPVRDESPRAAPFDE